MGLSRFEFEVLSYVENNGKKHYTVRDLADALCISGTKVVDALRQLEEKHFLNYVDDKLDVSDIGLDVLEPYRVKRAIIVGAGFGSRMMPATADRPKPMVTVNGIRIIDTLLDSLVAIGIRDIIVIGGYKIEKMQELLVKYPFVKILHNTKYEQENNISSAILSMDYFEGGCYFCEADLYISNPNIIKKYQYTSNFLGSWALETDDWCFKMENGFIDEYKKGGNYCFNYYGISYWSDEDSKKLKDDWVELYKEDDGKQLFWEFPALIQRKEKYKIEIRLCKKEDIMEIDNYYELAQIDSSYVLD